MMTLEKNKTYEISSPTGYFNLNGIKTKDGVHSITINSVITLDNEDDYLKIHKYKVVTV
jgi:hypothetical protein